MPQWVLVIVVGAIVREGVKAFFKDDCNKKLK